MASMDDHNRSAQALETGAQEKVAKAQEMRQAVDEAKQMFESVVGMDLDDEIKSAAEAGKETARSEATGDIEGVKSEVDSINSQAEQVKGEIQAKIAVNENAQSTLESLKSNRYGQGASDAISAVQQNTQKGMDVSSRLQQAMQNAGQGIEQSLSGI